MSSRPVASVIVPLYQDAATIGACLDSLSRQTIARQLEIIVADDGSRDGGEAIAASHGARVIRQANAGPGAARNSGAAASAGDILLFIDADCVTAPDWAERIVSLFDDPGLGAVLCPLEPSTSGIVPAIVQSELDERYERLRGRDGFDFLAGSFAVRASAFAQVGGFHEGFRYNEDVELAFSLSAAGHKINLAAGPPVRHAHYTAWRDLLKSKFWRGVWRMRLYRAFPHKRWGDSWTPMSLKMQIGAVALAPISLLCGLFDARAFWITAALLLVVLGTGVPLLRSTTRALKPSAGAAAPFWAGFWVLARAATLAASIAYAAIVPWKQPSVRHTRTLRFAAHVLVLGLGLLVALGRMGVADGAHVIVGPVVGGAPPQLFAFGGNTWRVPRVQRWVAPVLEAHTLPGTMRAALAWEILAASKGPGDIEQLLADYPLNDFLVATKKRGGAVIISLDAMPRWLARDTSERGLHDGPAWAKSPPADLALWSDVVERVVRHFDGKLGLEAYYEVWNEPDVFYRGLAEYVELYRASVAGARRANARARIAGPAISDWTSPARNGARSFWLREFIQALGRDGLPLDAVTWHTYSRDPATQYDLIVPIMRGWLREAGFSERTAVIVDEWNVAAAPPYPEGDHNATFVGAAYVGASLIAMARAGVDAQTYQMIVDPGTEGYSAGVFTVAGLPRPSFQAFRLFAQLKGERARVAVEIPWVQAVAYATEQDIFVLIAVMMPTDGVLARSQFEELLRGGLADHEEPPENVRRAIGQYVLGRGPRPNLPDNASALLDAGLGRFNDARARRAPYENAFPLEIAVDASLSPASVSRYEVIDRSRSLTPQEAAASERALREQVIDDLRRAQATPQMAGLVARWLENYGKQRAVQADESVSGRAIAEAGRTIARRFEDQYQGLLARELARSNAPPPVMTDGRVRIVTEPHAVHLLTIRRQ